MEILAWIFVGKPLNIAMVAGLWLVGYVIMHRIAPGRHSQSRWMLLSASLWGLYAAWEWLVLTNTPDANIRVDPLLIWPILAALSVWSVYRIFR